MRWLATQNYRRLLSLKFQTEFLWNSDFREVERQVVSFQTTEEIS